MKGRYVKKMTYLIVACLLSLWVFMSQSCMQFRISDEEARDKFSKHGVKLSTKYTLVNDFKMHYAEVGNESLPTLLLVHGSPGSWEAFGSYMQDSDLLQHYRMIAVDRPGFGYSQFSSAKNLEDQSLLIGTLVKTLQNGKPIYLVGHSLGGPLVVQLQIDYPQLFSGLVILSGAVDPSEEKPERWRPILFKTPLNFLVPGAFRPSNEELWYLKKDLMLMDKNWDKITCPVWIVHGDKDDMVPVNNVTYAMRKLTSAKSVKVKIIPGANHFIPWTHFKEIKDVLLNLHP